MECGNGIKQIGYTVEDPVDFAVVSGRTARRPSHVQGGSPVALAQTNRPEQPDRGFGRFLQPNDDAARVPWKPCKCPSCIWSRYSVMASP